MRKVACSECEGRGEVWNDRDENNGVSSMVNKTCHRCGGIGFIYRHRALSEQTKNLVEVEGLDVEAILSNLKKIKESLNIK